MTLLLQTEDKYKLDYNQTFYQRKNHIYLQEDVVKYFDKTRDFLKTDKLTSSLSKILSFFENKEKFHVFDGGIGTGNFTLSIPNILSESFVTWQIVGIDNSPPMLRSFEKKLWKDPIAVNYVKNNKLIYGYADMDFRLPFPTSYFDLAILSGVMHCLVNYQFTLTEMQRILRSLGILCIVSQNDMLIKEMCGSIDGNATDFADFWREYYNIRENMGIEFDKSLQMVFDLSRISAFLEESWEHIDTFSVKFASQISYLKFLEMIKVGCIHALGYGISSEQKEKLYKEMQKWCRIKEIDIYELTEYEHMLEFNIWRNVK